MINQTWFGNIIGIISLIITIITMIKAGKIEKKINKLKSDAIVKSKFNAHKTQLIASIKQECDAVINAEVLTNNAWNKLLSTIGEIERYEALFDQKDKMKIDESKKQVKMVIKSYKKDEDKIIDFIDVSNLLINILEKGDYSL